MRTTTLPFKRVQQGVITADPWQAIWDGETGPLAAELPHWDYNTNLRLVRNLTLNEAKIRSECELGDSASIAVAVVWRSSGTRVRGTACRVKLKNSPEPREVTLQAEIPGNLLAIDVTLSTQVIVASPVNARSPAVARFPGSLLWDDNSTVLLEGNASRFPMEVVDFTSALWAPNGAGWFLSWNSDELEQPFLRNVRLFVNASHQEILGAVQGVRSESASLIRSAIYYDVGRQLIRGALLNPELVDSPESFDDGSTGRAMVRMIELLFPAQKLSGLRDTMLSRPEHFDGWLQGVLQLFRPTR